MACVCGVVAVQQQQGRSRSAAAKADGSVRPCTCSRRNPERTWGASVAAVRCLRRKLCGGLPGLNRLRSAIYGMSGRTAPISVHPREKQADRSHAAVVGHRRGARAHILWPSDAPEVMSRSTFGGANCGSGFRPLPLCEPAAAQWGLTRQGSPWEARTVLRFFRFLASPFHSGSTPFWNPILWRATRRRRSQR